MTLAGSMHALLRGSNFALALAALVACESGDEPRVARGAGLDVAGLSATDQARVYRAAAGAAFDLGPGLVLLAHPLLLPREAGMVGGDSLPSAVVGAMRNAGTIAGTCDPAPPPRGELPRCDASAAGYIVRFSDVLRISHDTVQVYLDAEQYTIPGAPAQQIVQFEKAYQIVRQGGGWRVAREGRVPEAVTGRQR
ncbi:MAG TPA: hypothetical protein VK922_09910 [Gemmatimonadaceae bacterium]|nr:hypothetical protein [Gemmatimonadaceae bacterium]